RHTRWPRDWSSDVCSSDLPLGPALKDPDGFLGPGIGGEVELAPGGVTHQQFANRSPNQVELIAGGTETIPQPNGEGRYLQAGTARHGRVGTHRGSEHTLGERLVRF